MAPSPAEWLDPECGLLSDALDFYINTAHSIARHRLQIPSIIGSIQMLSSCSAFWILALVFQYPVWTRGRASNVCLYIRSKPSNAICFLSVLFKAIQIVRRIQPIFIPSTLIGQNEYKPRFWQLLLRQYPRGHSRIAHHQIRGNQFL